MADPQYPLTFFEGTDNQSAGFVTPYKIATGSNMGDLRVKGKITVVDDKGIVRLLIGYEQDGF